MPARSNRDTYAPEEVVLLLKFAMVVLKENGQSAAGDFKELKLIGEGSYGRVYRAIRRSDNREYETALSPHEPL